MFAHAMSSTSVTAAPSASSSGRASRAISPCRPMAWTPQSRLNEGYAGFRRRLTAFSSASSWATVVPGVMRANTTAQCPAFWPRSAASSTAGTKNWTPGSM